VSRLFYILSVVFLFANSIFADDHWGTTPPLPELNIYHYPAMGIIEISFVSDSTVDRPIWYILEVKQEGDPNANWFRPFNPLQGAVFNQWVTLELNYRDAAGQVFSWFKAEMVRVRVMWGA
jgi:hypothetical protein